MKLTIFSVAIIVQMFFYHPSGGRTTIPLDLTNVVTLSSGADKTPLQERELACIALTVYGEVGNVFERIEDIQAVTEVILNRVGHRMFGKPKDSCSVVLQKNQFEPLARNKQLLYAIKQVTQGNTGVIPNSFNKARYYFIKGVVENVYFGYNGSITNGAIGFYAPKAQGKLGRKAPYWSKKLTLVAHYGGHNFYR